MAKILSVLLALVCCASPLFCDEAADRKREIEKLKNEAAQKERELKKYREQERQISKEIFSPLLAFYREFVYNYNVLWKVVD